MSRLFLGTLGASVASEPAREALFSAYLIRQHNVGQPCVVSGRAYGIGVVDNLRVVIVTLALLTRRSPEDFSKEVRS